MGNAEALGSSFSSQLIPASQISEDAGQTNGWEHAGHSMQATHSSRAQTLPAASQGTRV